MSFSYLIYLYVLICVSLILFEIGWLIYFSAREKLQNKRSSMYENFIRERCDLLASGRNIQPIEGKERKRIRKILVNPHKIMALALAFQHVKSDYPDQIKAAVAEIDEEALFIMNRISKRTKIASNVYLLKLFADMTSYTGKDRPGELIEYQFRFITDPSVFCRTYAMEVLFAVGKAEDLHRAVLILSEKALFYHPKVLMNGLMTFRGDHYILSLLLVRDFERLSEDYRIAVLEYFRHRSPFIGSFLIEFLTGNYSIDVKCTTLRYFRKYPIPEAKSVIMGFLKDDSDSSWETAAIAAKALSAYPDPDVKALLKERLSHPNWHVRRNSAESLVSIGLSVSEHNEIMSGSDRFARDILEYNLLLAKESSGKAGSDSPGGDIL